MARSQKRPESLYALALASTARRNRLKAGQASSGLMVFTPRSRRRITTRGFDLFTWKWIDGKPVKETPEAIEARSAEHRRQRTASFFRQPKWTVDLVLSWIGFRDPGAIDTAFAPALYKDSRPTVEGRPRLVLLDALQRGEIRAVRQRGKLVDYMTAIEWFPVEEAWPVHLWPECWLASAEVRALWPALGAVIEHRAPANDPAEAKSPTLADEQTGESGLRVKDERVATKKRGRKKGSGSFRIFDLLLAQEVVRRVAAGEMQKKVLDDVATRARGSGTPASRAKRIEHLLHEARKVNEN